MNKETSLPPKEEILEMVKQQDEIQNAREFENKFSRYGRYSELIEWFDERNYGDGNEQFATVYFKPYDLYVSLIGTYSSYDGSTWEQCFVSRPYIHREVRFEPVEEKKE